METKLTEAVMKDLFKKAESAKKAAYAPYSKFHVGAALLTGDGSVFTGVNVENSSYPVGLCAERSAASAAVSAGKTDFVACAISGGERETCWPCGMCRQFLFEFGKDMTIITGSDADHLETAVLSDLLAKGFTL